jgi:hypothetical protein
LIALAIGAALTLPRGGVALWPAATLLALWPALGGHFVELVFLNVLRPRLPGSRAMQIGARVVVWFIGGALLALGLYATALLLPIVRPIRWQTFAWLGGPAFVAIELIAHAVLQFRRRPNFYNGRG